MSNYSLKERFIAKVLSRMPKAKSFIKDIYVRINALIYRPSFLSKFNEDYIDSISPVVKLKSGEEAFFGYYDKNPMNSEGWVINHIVNNDTSKPIGSKSVARVVLINIHTSEVLNVSATRAFNWQQGARAQWIDNELLIFNDFDEDRDIYVSKLYSLVSRSIIKTIDIAVQDSSSKGFFLSLNYRRLQKTTMDYGYNASAAMSDDDLFNLLDDGIFYANIHDESVKLLHSLKEISELGGIKYLPNTIHSVNHIMINKSGNSFIFIHRYYENSVRRDRLIFSDFNKMRVLSLGNMVSHCCWSTENDVIGYMRYKESDGYFKINVNTLKTEAVEELNLDVGDGHPSGSSEIIVFDSYPNRARLQSIFIYDFLRANGTKLLDVYQNVKYKGASRCDLHPRFDIDRNIIFFDAVFEGRRNQYYINLNK